MNAFIRNNKIDFDAIGTAFPNTGPLKYIDLTGEEAGCSNYKLDSDKYVLSSNIMNDFKPEEIEELEKDWELLKLS